MKRRPSSRPRGKTVGLQTSSPLDWLAGGGEMGERIRAFDWSETSLGPLEAWPQSLKTVVQVMLSSRYPMFVWWGRELVNIYNDAYAPLLGGRHPQALARCAAHIWEDVWSVVGPQTELVMNEGRATWNQSILLVMERHGYTEEAYFTFSYSPVPNDTGGVGGVFCAVTEDTERVLGERRLRMLHDLGKRSLAEAKTAELACQAAAATLAENPHDIPFALIYLLDKDGKQARLCESVNLLAGTPASPATVSIQGPDDVWGFGRVLETHESHIVENLEDQFGSLPAGPWTDVRTKQALVVPLSKAGGQELPAGVLVAGISPRLAFGNDYRGFLGLAAGQVAAAIANARAYEEERARAQALEELDRAKTIFFSNVSHEFRTPLTLMLGPVEELLARADGWSTDIREQLTITHRNSLRLLKLVNTLLDFSRIEAGRIRAFFEPTDLASFTAELASAFQSATEQAGLRLIVDCPALTEPVYVDRGMWEKIVLNLISNAFKFTFAGDIIVSLRRIGFMVELRVIDTGEGIPDKDIPHLFERFYRVEQARSRTHEGSGIGLALVHELIKLHGGSVRAESRIGQGSTFIVTVPFGTAHLPSDRIGTDRLDTASTIGTTPFVEEALRWLPDIRATEESETENEAWESVHSTAHTPDPSAESQAKPRVLVADDNADMREYIRRLLAQHYHVDTVADGEAALEYIRAAPPDLVVSDVMMPRLNGFGLLKELRADPALNTIPVVLLSARAGEESRLEGLHRGADDYLIKPFSARELLARVDAHINIARLRRTAELDLRASEARFRALADSAPAMLWMSQPDGSCSFRSRGWQIFTGQAESAGLGLGWLDAVHPDDRDTLLRAFRNANEQHAPFHAEYRLRHRDRGHRWVIDDAAPRFDAAGQFLGYTGSVMDISERKEAEKGLRESEERFRLLADSAPALIWVNNLVGCEYVNREYLEFLGVQIRQLSGYDWAQYIHPEDRDEYVTTYFGAMERRDLFEKEFRFRRHDGEYRWMRSVGRPRLDREGNLVGYAGLTIDITDRRQAEEVARHLASIVDSSDDAIFSKDLEGNIRSWNTGAERIFGYTADEIMGRPGSLLIPSERTDEEPEILKRIMRGERIEHYETVRRRKDGRDIAISLTVSPMTDANWRVTGASKIARDITERRRAEKSLRASEEQLRALAGQLEGLVHERTQELVASQERLRALATELNLTEQRERRRLATELHDYLAQLLALSKIKLSQAKQQPMAPPLAKALTGIQDVLDQALSYTRSMVAQLSPPELHEFGLPSALKWLAEQMKERDLTVWLDLKPDMAPLPEDQAVLLFQSVRELLINVTKHGRTIHATVSIREAAGMLRIEVVDHGAGFDLAAAKIGAKPGFGLFSIRERMIALGGHFELVSRPGEGTQATLILPLKPRVASVESGTTNEPFPHAGMRNLQPGESTFRPS